MEVYGLKCPSCGAAMNFDIAGRNSITCPYCSKKLLVDDGALRVEQTVNVNETKQVTKESIVRKVLTNEADIIRAQNEGKNTRVIAITIVAILVISLISGFFVGRSVSKRKYSKDDTLVLDERVHTVVEFTDAIVGKAVQKGDLIVEEQEVSIVTTISKQGLFDWSIFGKNQSVTYYGTAQYTVDLAAISDKDIMFDEDRNQITVRVQSPSLHAIVFSPDKTIVGDVDKGLLAFGDIKLDVEEMNIIETDAVNKLTERANEADCLSKAEEYAKYVLRDLFEEFAAEIDKKIKVKVELYDK